MGRSRLATCLRRPPLSTHAFATNTPFTVAGVLIAKDATLVEAGVDTAIMLFATLGLFYNRRIASSSQQHGFEANLNVKF